MLLILRQSEKSFLVCTKRVAIFILGEEPQNRDSDLSSQPSEHLQWKMSKINIIFTESEES